MTSWYRLPGDKKNPEADTLRENRGTLLSWLIFPEQIKVLD
jgi:hypothetical protein